MNTTERKALAAIIQKYCRELKVMDTATANAAQEAVSNGVNAKTTAGKRYYAASEFVKSIDPAWRVLTDIAQHILTEFYGQRKRHSGAVQRLCSEYQLSERQIYYLCADALQRFSDHIDELKIGKEEIQQ